MKLSFIVFVFCLSFFQSSFSFGENGGRGADEVSRLVNKARNEVVPDILAKVSGDDSSLSKLPMIKAFYSKIRQKLLENLKPGSTPLIAVDEVLLDKIAIPNIETWMATEPVPGGKIFYNRHEEVYEKYVHMACQQNCTKLVNWQTPTKPDLQTITEYMLHEVGHQYGLQEDDAWAFAQTLLNAYEVGQASGQVLCQIVSRQRTGTDAGQHNFYVGGELKQGFHPWWNSENAWEEEREKARKLCLEYQANSECRCKF